MGKKKSVKEIRKGVFTPAPRIKIFLVQIQEYEYGDLFRFAQDADTRRIF